MPKIKNATATIIDGIAFKSKLEAQTYQLLKDEGINVSYEAVKVDLFKGLYPTVPFYTKDSSGKLTLNKKKIRDITFTPDFYVIYKSWIVYIECKGFKQDSYNVKVKLFRQYLERLKESGYKNMFFEVYSKTQVKQAIEILKAL